MFCCTIEKKVQKGQQCKFIFTAFFDHIYQGCHYIFWLKYCCGCLIWIANGQNLHFVQKYLCFVLLRGDQNICGWETDEKLTCLSCSSMDVLPSNSLSRSHDWKLSIRFGHYSFAWLNSVPEKAKPDVRRKKTLFKWLFNAVLHILTDVIKVSAGWYNQKSVSQCFHSISQYFFLI